MHRNLRRFMMPNRGHLAIVCHLPAHASNISRSA
jgi:hypothetical protein